MAVNRLGHRQEGPGVSYKPAVVRAERPPSSLSALPTGVLCRSLLVNAVSSKPYLLGPAISFMGFLCRPNRPFLLDIGRNKLLAGIMRKAAYRQFCAGESASQVRTTLRRFRGMGFRGTIVTYARETVFDCNKSAIRDVGIETFTDEPAGASCPYIGGWRRGVLETIDLLGDGDHLAVKYANTTHQKHRRTRRLTRRAAGSPGSPARCADTLATLGPRAAAASRPST
ncbi:Proline oxidase [Metarhizium album ARSEF 1941]|uniref:Proline dehydrogenase n=1 Tax=Metarhizium album (strain ARSEF 1941) TaxID=1081103 RepID=A0A0B2WP59_METAS|nr:Proline oxidase [Metarhizium album ARSEF 1941]KHN95242.1 Proline oxidase [Metarhizium album ARSEF 1941]